MGRKSKKIRLDVFLDQQPVGALERSSTGEVSFIYNQGWLSNSQSIALSASLPLREQSYRGQLVTAYFDNLLPDNEVIRSAIAARVGAASASSLDLLAALGRDCVGALQFFASGQIPTFRKAIQARPLSDKEIAQRLRTLTVNPLGISSNEEFRISIAGAQEKTALLFYKNRWCLPIDATPTSHIFKVRMGVLPNGIDLSTSLENEWLCLTIARHLGLDVSEANLATFEDVDCLIVKRFDRAWNSNRTLLRRLPQEDLCQALGVPSTRKYEADGGPGIVKIMELLDASDNRNEDRAQFMRAQLVFFLLAATDGHAKNFSIVPNSVGFRMTPLYDILSVASALHRRQLERKNAKLAMCVGESRHYRLHEIRFRHWQQTAKLCGFSPRFLDAIVEDLGNRIETLPTILKNLPKAFPPQLLEEILSFTDRQFKILSA